jgi:hypothetical protein
MLEEVKRQLIEERGIYRAILIPIVVVLVLTILTLVLDVIIAVASTVGIFLVAIFILNFILPDSLKTIAFSAGARVLTSGIGIMVTLCFIVARYMATFLWWSKWFWALLILPFALFVGFQDFYTNMVSSIDSINSSGLIPTSDSVRSFFVSFGDVDPGLNLMTILIATACILMWSSMLYCSWWGCGKALKYIAEKS